MVSRLRKILYLCIFMACILGFLFPNKHPHFWWQKIPIYDAIFGFLGCILIVAVAKWAGHRWLMRDEAYYD